MNNFLQFVIYLTTIIRYKTPNVLYQLFFRQTLAVKCVILFIICLCSADAQAQLTVGFTASDTAGCAPFSVHFTNTSTGATSYAWDLGNGTTSSATDVSGSYLSVGSYTVTLTASNAGGSKKYSLVINAYTAPTVNFFASSGSVCPGTPVTFTSTSIANCWGTLSYTWNFGDGGGSTATSPVYNYAVPGSYNVTLSAVNKAGCTGSKLQSGYIYVYQPALVSFSTPNSFFCKAPATASFSNLTTGTPPLSYTWLFGDGGTSVATNPTHSYTTSGTNNVTLRVTDGTGCTDSMVQTATVKIGNLTAGYTSVTKACLYSSVTFKNASTPHISSSWSFGDGATSTSDTAVHAYSVAGNYIVKLVVYDGTCYDSISRVINIYQPTGTVSISKGCQPPAPVTMSALVPPGSTVSWSSLLYGPLGSGNTVTFTYPKTIGNNLGGVIDGITMYLTDASGCKDTVGKIIDSVNSLFVNLKGTPDNKGCIPLTVTYSASLAALVYTPFASFPPSNLVNYPYPYGIATYAWDFGDGTTSTLSSPVHTYTAQGVYPVTCNIRTTNGCVASGVDSVSTGAVPPVNSFTMSRSRECTGQPVTFTSTSTGLINGYQWDFADGNHSIVANPVQIYKTPGVYNPTLIAYYNGCGGPAAMLNDTADAPGATINYTYACIPDNVVNFYDTANTDNNHLWSFGDGTTSTVLNPSHSFPALSTYTVTLTTDNTTNGCRDTSYQNIYLERLSVSFKPYKTSICRDAVDSIGANINTYVGPGGIVEVSAAKAAWYLNGVLTDTHIPYIVIASKMYDSVYHTFSRRGLDTVTLILTDNNGCFDTASQSILVAKPVANYTFTPGTGCSPLPVKFTDATTDVAGAFISKYSWTYGDGSSLALSAPLTSHTYLASGAFTVQEIVTDNVGCMDTFTSASHPTVSKPSASFSASSQYICVNTNINFNNTSSGAVSYLWMFGDGATTTLALPSHRYIAPGVYTVKLVATNALGCTDTMTQAGYITVNSLPVASFHMDDSFAICPPLTVNFINTSTGASSYQWSFGDGAHSTNNNPGDIYTVPGAYRVKLQVVNTAGCTDTAIGNVSIGVSSAAFTYTPLSACSSTPVTFKATISGSLNITWDFSDGTTAGPTTSTTITHRYALGAYIPKLILTDTAKGCSSFSLGADTIRIDTLVPGFTFSPHHACLNTSTAFLDSSTTYLTPLNSWKWSFGTGATSTLNNPAYTYTVAGTHAVTLTVGNAAGCKLSITKNVVVSPLPGPVSGPAGICLGQTGTFTDTSSGGVWSSANTSVMTIDGTTGFANTVSPASTTILYTLPSGCSSSMITTVNAIPPAIKGSLRICQGFTNTFSDIASGGTWSSSDASIASIGSGSGIVTGVNPGTASITYQLTGGCFVDSNIIVDQSPKLITGLSAVCIGGAIVLTDAVAGGNWTTSSTSLAVVGPGTGVVTGVATGLVAIIYSLNTGCNVSKIITVTAPVTPITGPSDVCLGSVASLTDAPTGGAWSSGNTTVATVTLGTGKVTGQAAGTATISYTNTAGCILTTSVTVDTLPAAVTGVMSVCAGATTSLSDPAGAGSWNTANTTIATVGVGTGIVSGIKSGTATITYADVGGCKASTTVTVNSLPLAISGDPHICVGYTTTLSDATNGGAWSSSNTSIATVDPSLGIVSGSAFGTATITYTLPTGCGITQVVTVGQLTTPITGPNVVCAGYSIALSDAAGGTWTSANTVVATVDPGSGIVTSLIAGTTTISYTAPTGCFATSEITVNPMPVAISGIDSVCTGLTTALSDAATGGGWNSSNTVTAIVDAGSGIVSGVSAGTAMITYSFSTGCQVTQPVTVNSSPAPIVGLSVICNKDKTTLSDADAGGAWTSHNTVVATINRSTGMFSGSAPGTDTISYTFNTGCKASTVVTVNPLPAPIKGITNVCAGLVTLLTNDTTGGGWSSGNTAVAVVSSGTVLGVSAGTTTITYMLGTGCMSTVAYTVNPDPSIITGATHLCAGSTTMLSDSLAGGTWSSSTTSVAVVDVTSGSVTGVFMGTMTITYSSPAHCLISVLDTVFPVLQPLIGTTTFCKGVRSLLTEVVPGGQWSSSDTGIAAVDVSSGLVTGVDPGTAVVTYSLVNSCGTANARIQINPLPYAGVIHGPVKVCTGASIALTDSIGGGLWSSADYKIADIDSIGLVNGITAATVTISYTYTNSCGTDVARDTITVNQTAPPTRITTHPDSLLCANTEYMNFGTDSLLPQGGKYTWGAANADIYATGKDGQYCLISFNTSGTGTITLSTSFPGSDCISTDVFPFTVGQGRTPNVTVLYYSPEFVCTDNTAESYQWGYDDAFTLDSTIIKSAVNQNYTSAAPDLLRKNYWVLTMHNGCLQKSYYNVPTAIRPVYAAGNLEILLFPNPADASINIELKGNSLPGEVVAKVFDVSGKERYTGKIEQGSGVIDVHDLVPGVYMVVISNNGIKIGTKVFVKK